MPGIELNLPIPSLSDTQTQVVTKVAQALTLIDTDLAAKVIPSEIDINGSISFNGNPLTNLGYLVMGGGTPGATIPGAMYYNNGEWFIVDSSGTIQLTSNGFINISGTGGIGGDYSAVSALVSYNSAGSKYIFLGAAATGFVDVDVRKVILEGAGPATVTIGVDASLVTNKVVNFKSLPTANVGLIAYDAASNAIVDGSTNTITAPVTFSGTVTLSAGFTGTDHSTYVREVPFTLGPACNNVNINTFDKVTSSAAVWLWRSEPLDVDVGHKITTVLARITKPASPDTVTVALKKINVTTGTITSIQSNTLTGATTGDVTVTVGSPTAVIARERWYIEISGDGASGFGSGDLILGLSFTRTA